MYKNISQKYYFLFIGILLLSISSIVYAETIEQSSSTESLATSTNPDTTKNISTSTNDNLTSSTTESTTTDTSVIFETEKPIVEQKLPINQTPLSDAEQKRITNLCANISNRLDAVIARQDNISQRLNSRILKMKAIGIDTTSAEAKLAEVDITIKTSKNTIKNIDSQVNQTVTSLTPKTAWQSVYATYNETEKLVKQTQGELREVIQLLKSPNTIPVIEKEENSTSTFEIIE